MTKINKIKLFTVFAFGTAEARLTNAFVGAYFVLAKACLVVARTK